MVDVIEELVWTINRFAELGQFVYALLVGLEFLSTRRGRASHNAGVLFPCRVAKTSEKPHSLQRAPCTEREQIYLDLAPITGR